MTLGSLYIEAQGYVPALLENLPGMSCSGTCWLLGGAWFQCEVWRLLDALLSINVPWSQEFSGVLSIGLKPPASGFQSYSYSSLKTSPSIQHQ